MTINELLNKARASTKEDTDIALAKILGHSASEISHWRRGDWHPSTDVAYKLGEMAGLKSPWDAVALVEFQTAKKPEKKAFWESVLQQKEAACLIAAGGAALLSHNHSDGLGLMLMGFTSSKTSDRATLYIMSNRRRFYQAVCGWFCKVSKCLFQNHFRFRVLRVDHLTA